MSHCASFLCLNGLFESSFFYAEHLTASDKYKFSRQECVIREFCFAKTTKTSKCLARQSVGTTGNSFPASDKALERLEIRCQRATRDWNQRKFLVSVQQGTGASGNSFPANDETLELAEISCQRTTEHWNQRKFVVSERRDAGTSGNCRSAVRCLPSFPTENSRGELEKHKNSQTLFTLQTTAAGGGGKK